jgi:hypothetical protein
MNHTSGKLQPTSKLLLPKSLFLRNYAFSSRATTSKLTPTNHLCPTRQLRTTKKLSTLTPLTYPLRTVFTLLSPTMTLANLSPRKQIRDLSLSNPQRRLDPLSITTLPKRHSNNLYSNTSQFQLHLHNWMNILQFLHSRQHKVFGACPRCFFPVAVPTKDGHLALRLRAYSNHLHNNYSSWPGQDFIWQSKMDQQLERHADVLTHTLSSQRLH